LILASSKLLWSHQAGGSLSLAFNPTARAGASRGLISASIILATVMPAIDTTIANVALPSMAGSMSASADQITWVLTSYIIGVAVMTPVSGWLAQRFGRKRILIISVIGFTIVSALCGTAHSLGEMIAFRALQGVFGAPMAPLAQAVILDTYELEERGPALAMWAMALMVAPILGPVLGGHLTETLGWRWVFYINLPIGVIAALGVAAFIPEDRADRKTPLDFGGWVFLSIFMVCMQLMLDRGQSQDWFDSPEILTYVIVGAIALHVFVFHNLTTAQPFLPLALFRDPNFMTASLVNMCVGMSIYSAMALLPPLMEGLMAYPAEAAGWALAPRGVGAFISNFVAGRLVGKIDDRAMVCFGLLTFALSFWQMGGLSPDMDSHLIMMSGLVQGLGSGFIFIPITTLAFATLDPSVRVQATGLNTLLRNLGTSLGISLMVTTYTRYAQASHERLAGFTSPDNPMASGIDFADPQALAALDNEVTRQASAFAYADVFLLLCALSLALMPLVLLLKRPKKLA
jgi:DHA2 family multidrug resistance protein